MEGEEEYRKFLEQVYGTNNCPICKPENYAYRVITREEYIRNLCHSCSKFYKIL